MRWPRCRLRAVAPPAPAEASFQPDDEVWLLTLDQIEGHTGVVLEKPRKIADSIGNSTFTFDTGHVLYSKLRPYLNKVVCPDEPGIATTELIPLRPHSAILDRKFLAYYLRSPRFLSYASQYVVGAKMPRVISDRFWQHEIPLPPLSEQRRIVEILDQADRLRRLRAEADAKADRILAALFIEIFGDPASKPMSWRRKPIRELARVTTGNTPPRAMPDFYGDYIEWIKSDNINTASHYLTPASERLSESGAKLGRIAPAGSTMVTCIAGSPGVIGNARSPTARSPSISRSTPPRPRAASIPTFCTPNFLSARG
jgi:type I restriction enzyme S subunit